MTEETARMEDFSRDISDVINRYSMENPSGTPDFILGDLLTSVLASYNHAVARRAEWRMEPVELPVTQKVVDKLNFNVESDRRKSHFQKVIDGIIEEQVRYRQQYIEYLMSNPGFLATFGEDFVVEYRAIDLSTIHDQTYNNLNEYRVTFSQEVRFYRREVWEAIQSAAKIGLAEEVRDLRAQMQKALDQGDEATVDSVSRELSKRADDLKDLGLRIDPNGNLESV